MGYQDIAIKYWQDILDGNITANYYQKRAAEKYFQLLKTEYHDVKKVEQFCWLQEHTYHPELQKNLPLLPWMVQWFSVVVGFPKLKLAYLEVQRKNSKTSSILMPLQIWEIFTQQGSETHFISGDWQQCRQLYNQYKNIIQQNDFLKEKIKTTSISSTNLNLGGQLYTHASASKMLDSYKNSLTLLDELHSYQTDNALTQSRYGGSARDKQLICITTSAGLSKTNAGYAERINAEEYLKSNELRTDYFQMIYQIDPEDDWENESCWIKQNPSLGIITKWDQFRYDQAEQKKSPEKLLNFKSKRLGLYQNLGTVKFFNTEKIQMIKSKPLEEDPINQKNVLAFDLSEINDFTVVSKCWPLKDGTFYIHHYYFLPELTIYDVYTKSKRKINHLLPDWVDKGLIETCPGQTISYTMITDRIMGLVDQGTKIIQYDSYHAAEIIDVLNKKYKRLPLIPLKQSAIQQTEHIKFLEKTILDENLYTTNDDPVFQWMLENATLKDVGSGFKKIYKPAKSDVNKIDACITTLMALQVQTLPIVQQDKKSQSLLI